MTELHFDSDNSLLTISNNSNDQIIKSIQLFPSVEDTVKTLVAIYKLIRTKELNDNSALRDAERLLSVEKHEQWSQLNRRTLARYLYIKIVNYVIKCVNRLGPSQPRSSDTPLSLFILSSFPPAIQKDRTNNLQDLLVNLHKETFRVR